MHDPTERPNDEQLKLWEASIRTMHKSDVDLTDQIMNRIREQSTSNRNNERPEVKLARTGLIAVSVAAVLFLGLASSAYVSPSMAKALKEIPGASHIFAMTGDAGLRTADEQELLTRTALADSHNGLSIQAPEFMYDGTRLSIALKRQPDSGQTPQQSLIQSIQDVQLQIDGEPISTYAGANGDNTVDPMMIPGYDPDTLILELSDLRNQQGRPFPDQFQLTLQMKVSEAKQPFTMDLPVQKNTQHMLVATPNVQRQDKHIQFTVANMEFTPVTTNITTKIQLSGGQKIDLDTIMIEYDVVDDQGHKLSPLSGGSGYYEHDGSMITVDSRFAPLTDLPKSITIKPYRKLLEPSDPSQFQKEPNGDIKVEYLPELQVTIPLNR
ncbi:DUF4179 domain-containing protein [Paenibacillus wulumuqiensis]|uniref:DUF4179 domain-containing protein n=1 Tax=Paenibacillus wulumuqiensis TaxID=1567107 RepID=UPI0006190561|nr:DUF4179 domain-containing protein [Paenibacillus wulumuqiensis]